jgi:hypothetical protein
MYICIYEFLSAEYGFIHRKREDFVIRNLIRRPNGNLLVIVTDFMKLLRSNQLNHVTCGVVTN